jgi:hypothetical protein
MCSFFGGFLYAFPTLVSIFYSVCIALNTQLVFVFSKRPGSSILKYYIGIPILLSLAICIPALALGLYGYDQSWDMCWYATEGKTPNEVLLQYLFTFGLWCLVSMFYLTVSAITIMVAVFSKSSKVNRLATNMSNSLASKPVASSVEHKRVSFLPEISETGTLQPYPDGVPHFTPYTLRNGASQRLEAKLAQRQQRFTLSRRSLAMRALSFRLLGYILVPTLCILPGVIQDLISKIDPDAVDGIPDQVGTLFDTLNGLVGLFNAILFALDPALLTLYHQISVERSEKRGQRRNARDAETGQDAVYSPQESASSQPSTTDTVVTRVDYGDSAEKVEVRKGKYLTPIRIADHLQKVRSPLSPPNSSGGIVIRVEVEVHNDLEQLGDFLKGL